MRCIRENSNIRKEKLINVCFARSTFLPCYEAAKSDTMREGCAFKGPKFVRHDPFIFQGLWGVDHRVLHLLLTLCFVLRFPLPHEIRSDI